MSSESFDFSGLREDTVEMRDIRLRELTQLANLISNFLCWKVEMRDTRLRELTHDCPPLADYTALRRNEGYPIKGIASGSAVLPHALLYTVEMKHPRLRELTRLWTIIPMYFRESRNERSPIKGIDTLFFIKSTPFLSGRNGIYPIKGIDTSLLSLIFYLTLSVEKEDT